MKLALIVAATLALATASGPWTELYRLVNPLAFQLHPFYGGQRANVVYSPLGISASLAMIYGAAHGKTAKNIWNKCGYYGLNDVHLIYKDTRQMFINYYSTYGVFAHKNYSIKVSYKKLIQGYYQSMVNQVDFTKIEDSRSKINQYVKSKINKFSEYLEQDLDRQTKLYYLSALYYGDSLMHHTGNSYNGQFYGYGDYYSEVIYSVLRGPMFYYSSDDYKAVRIPFKNSGLCLMVVIPEIYSSLDQLKENFSYYEYHQIWSKMNQIEVQVHFANFSINLYQPLSDIFKSAGYTFMFEDGADFSALSSKDLRLSQVGHRAYLELVNPEPNRQYYFPSYEQPTLKVDQPFLFYVVEQVTGFIVFSGYVSQL